MTGDRIQLLSGLLVSPTVALDAAKNNSRSGTLVATQVEEARIEGNSFTGFTFAAMVHAETGEAKFADNRVRECYAGICYLSPRSLPFLEFVAHVPLDAGDIAIKQQVHAGISALAQESAIIVTALLARLYPIPFGFDWQKLVTPTLITKVEVKIEAVFRPEISLVESGIQKLEREIAPLISLFKRISPWKGLSAAPAATDPPTVLPGAGPLLDPAFLLHQDLAALERQALAQHDSARQTAPPSLSLSLRVSGNDIDAILSGGASGLALLVWDDERDTRSMLFLSENKFESSSLTLPTALVLLVHRCIIRGNFFLNDAPQKETGFRSLVLLAGEQAAFSGNVYRGEHTQQ